MILNVKRIENNIFIYVQNQEEISNTYYFDLEEISSIRKKDNGEYRISLKHLVDDTLDINPHIAKVLFNSLMEYRGSAKR